MILTSINQGRLGTIVVALILPPLITLLSRYKGLLKISWRKIFSITLVASVAAAFSPLFLISWICFHLAIVINHYSTETNWRTTKWQVILKNLGTDEIKKRFALLITPVLLNVPHSFNLILHPIKALQEPGLSIESGDQVSVLLFNPGGVGSPGLFILAPFLLFLLITVISYDQRKTASLAVVVIATAATLSSYYITGNSSGAERIWSGPLIIFAQLLTLLAFFAVAERLLPQLRKSNFGFKHIVTVLTTVITVILMVSISVWAATAGANSLVRSNQEQVVPAFITDLASTSEQPKTLVIRKTTNQLQYFITRGGDLQLGDADFASKTPELVHKGIVDLVNGVGAASSQVLGYYGVQYLFMKNPADAALVRTIDGIGGYTRSSATKDGVVWKVNNSNARVTYQNPLGKNFSISLTDDESLGYVTGPGQILLAEKYDKAWQLIMNGKKIPVEQNIFGLPVFKVSEAGDFSLTHNGEYRNAWISMQMIALIATIVLALPAGRKRSEVPLEELV